ncbi:hypothetical protein CC86DRAFT_397572 [Ophiobolus disseminans]|uniref:Uncharacterized protein n=1 Tax=Ophiobolus disseminans TaxID=1469910 RepID=A0A6A6ZIZ1_9PLEO|nr:hypothetical protein CC86DRAFT_397572 [Ophiobolus disseminans]
MGWLGAQTIRVLLAQFGVDWFNDSGTLHLANVTDWQMDIRENRAAPLPALYEAVFAKSEEMIRYLAEHGAKLTRKKLHLSNPYYSLPEEYSVFVNLLVELDAVKEETSL